MKCLTIGVCVSLFTTVSRWYLSAYICADKTFKQTLIRPPKTSIFRDIISRLGTKWVDIGLLDIIIRSKDSVFEKKNTHQCH